MEKGYWRLNEMSVQVLPCLGPQHGEDVCRGGINRTGNDLCYSGYTGPQCARCDFSYYRDSVSERCVDCESEGES